MTLKKSQSKPISAGGAEENSVVRKLSREEWVMCAFRSGWPRITIRNYLRYPLYIPRKIVYNTIGGIPYCPPICKPQPSLRGSPSGARKADSALHTERYSSGRKRPVLKTGRRTPCRTRVRTSPFPPAVTVNTAFLSFCVG